MIIADVTVLITLINIDELKLLKLFTDKVFITKEVYKEVSKKPFAKNILDNEVKIAFLEIKEYKNRTLFEQINIILDKGEASSIVLALEKKLPLIIDEKKGRRFAISKGIEIAGLIGIIKYLYSHRIITEKYTKELMEKLKNSNFRITNQLIELILKED